jgi:hypothetical protein
MLHFTSVNKDGCSSLSWTSGKGTQELDRCVQYSFDQRHITDILAQQ